MKAIAIFFALLMLGMVYFHEALSSGKILAYIDQHQKERGMMRTTYYIGHGYNFMQDLQQAATYYLRVAQRYPGVPMAEEGYFSYLQSLQDSAGVHRSRLIEGYQAYLEKYPNGKYVKIAQDRIDLYRTGGS